MLAILAMTDGKMTATDIPAVLLHETGKKQLQNSGKNSGSQPPWTAKT
jgi:hypothetical protein